LTILTLFIFPFYTHQFSYHVATTSNPTSAGSLKFVEGANIWSGTYHSLPDSIGYYECNTCSSNTYVYVLNDLDMTFLGIGTDGHGSVSLSREAAINNPSFYRFNCPWANYYASVPVLAGYSLRYTILRGSCPECYGNPLYFEWKSIKDGVMWIDTKNITLGSNTHLMTFDSGVKYSDFRIHSQGGNGTGIYKLIMSIKDGVVTLPTYTLESQSSPYSNTYSNIFFDAIDASILDLPLEFDLTSNLIEGETQFVLPEGLFDYVKTGVMFGGCYNNNILDEGCMKFMNETLEDSFIESIIYTEYVHFDDDL
jgi:hypothetical protein